MQTQGQQGPRTSSSTRPGLSHHTDRPCTQPSTQVSAAQDVQGQLFRPSVIQPRAVAFRVSECEGGCGLLKATQPLCSLPCSLLLCCPRPAHPRSPTHPGLRSPAGPARPESCRFLGPYKPSRQCFPWQDWQRQHAAPGPDAQPQQQEELAQQGVLQRAAGSVCTGHTTSLEAGESVVWAAVGLPLGAVGRRQQVLCWPLPDSKGSAF
jgi:hypothetical protein